MKRKLKKGDHSQSGPNSTKLRNVMLSYDLQTVCSRFFVNFQKGKCTAQPIGKQKISKMPRRIAEYLKLSTMDGFTGNLHYTLFLLNLAYNEFLLISFKVIHFVGLERHLRQVVVQQWNKSNDWADGPAQR